PRRPPPCHPPSEQPALLRVEVLHPQVRSHVRVAEPEDVLPARPAAREYRAALGLDELAERRVEEARILALRKVVEPGVLLDDIAAAPLAPVGGTHRVEDPPARLHFAPALEGLRDAYREGALNLLRDICERGVERRHRDDLLVLPLR